jgi:hypothetical protein
LYYNLVQTDIDHDANPVYDIKMARFYDHAKRDAHLWKDEDLSRKLGAATVIDASSLSDYLYANDKKGEWDLLEDFFNLAPPFSNFWIECRAPKQMFTAKGLVPWSQQLPTEWGVLFLATEISKLSENELHRIPGGTTPEVHWVLQAILFARFRHPNSNAIDCIRPQFSWWIPIRADGSQPKRPEPQARLAKILFEFPIGEVKDAHRFQAGTVNPNEGTLTVDEDYLRNYAKIEALDGAMRFWRPDSSFIDIKSSPCIMPEQELEKTQTYTQILSLAPDVRTMSPGWVLHFTGREEQLWLPLLCPCLMAICFLHVKNVILERTIPPIPVQKKAVKNYGTPLTNYHVLKIQPFRKVLESQGNSAESGIQRALHACRGHFATYGGVHGKLFGKLEGTYWVPAHMRGNIERGLADKEYRVRNPEVA